jgi:hypothetical protein
MWKIRNGRAFQYESIRTDGRVKSRYIKGSGRFAFSVIAEKRRRAEERAAKIAWLPVQCFMEETERSLVHVDDAMAELATAAMLAAGFRRVNRGRWRKRRSQASTGEGDSMSGVAPLIDLLDRLAKAKGKRRERLTDEARSRTGALISGAKAGDLACSSNLGLVLARRPDLTLPVGVVESAGEELVGSGGEVEATWTELAGPTPVPLETLVSLRVALAWWVAADRDVAVLDALGRKSSPFELEFRDELRTRANSRFLAATLALAQFRGLALPAMRVSLGEAGFPASSTIQLQDRGKKMSDTTIDLMERAVQGDQAAFRELKRIGETTGKDYSANWLPQLLEVKLQARASHRDLLLRSSVAEEIHSHLLKLSHPSDGPSEQIVVRRSALAAVDAQLADLEHLRAIGDGQGLAITEALDRRRDRANRRLMQCLKVLAQIRRLNRPVVQVNLGDNNVNVLKT